MNRNVLVVVVLLAAILVSASPTLLAQTIVTGEIRGTVTDPTGAVIADAKITLTNLATNQPQEISTTSDGLYQFSLLKPGNYSILVEKEGFAKVTQPVTVLLGQSVTANVQMQTGSVSTSIQVEAAPPLLQTENANLTTVFEQKEISQLPNPGNDITYTAQTAPGVLMNNSTLGGYGNFTAFGLPGTANLFTIDGNDYNDPFLNLNNSGSSNLLLGNDAIAEVAVVSNGYTGQYGRQASVQIDYTTKQGTNGLHGDMLYDWTGRAITANDPINKLGEQAAGLPNTRPFANNNQWAAAIGGPIIKNKAFFFVETEGIRYIFGSNATTYSPTDAFKTYVLGNIPQDAKTLAFYNNVFNLYSAAAAGHSPTAVDNSCASVTAIIGAKQDCLETWSGALSNGNVEWLLSGRVDYAFDANNKLFARFVKDKGTQPTYTDPINPAFSNQSIQPQWQGQINYTHVFTPNVLNSLIISGFYYSALFGSQNPQKALSLFPGNLWASADGSLLTPLGTGSGSPNGFASGFLYPQGRNETQYQFVDDLSIFRGIHAFKMGINYRWNLAGDHTIGELNQYPVILTSLAGFANDQISPAAVCPPTCGVVNENFAAGGRLSQNIRLHSFGLYFQDEIRVTPKFKLTLALRAEHNSPGSCNGGCTALPPTSWDQISHSGDTPYHASFQTGRDQVFPSIEAVNFQPRVGVAWTPFGNTVIRGGIGLFTDLYPGVLLNYFTTNFPQDTQWSVDPGTSTVAFDNLGLASTAYPNSGPSFVKGCNEAFSANYAAGGTVGDYLASAPASCSAALPNYQATQAKVLNPKYLEWNIEVQHTFGKNTVFSANYVGNHGYDEVLLNPFANAFCDVNCAATASTGTLLFDLTKVGLPAVAPDPRVATVFLLTNNSYSNYHGLTLGLQENGIHGFSGRLSYTYSHSNDIASNGGVNPYAVLTSLFTQLDPFNPKAQYASSDYDARHQFNASYLYELPFKSENRLLDAAIGGWQVSGTFFVHTGFPFSVIDGLTGGAIGPTHNFSDALTGGSYFVLQPVPGFNQRDFTNGRQCASALFGLASPCFNGPPDVCDPNAPAPATCSPSFLAPTAFVGKVGRNAFRGPGFFGGDLSIRKMFNIHEQWKFQLGVNMFNWTNHANFGHAWGDTVILPTGTDFFTATEPTSPYGAFAAAATDQRIIQIQGKLFF
jgi:hypothetical protein